MSEPENFLARWSRRKLEHDASEPDGPERTEPQADAAADRPADASAQTPTEGAEPPALPQIDLDSLPSIDSITAATDIKAFLRPGVPLDLQRAALRRMWTADPAIRDYIGLSEYSWDYNTLEGLQGFGPLPPTEELRKMVADIIGNVGAEMPAKAGKASVAAEPKPGAQEHSDAQSIASPEAVASPTGPSATDPSSIGAAPDNKVDRVSPPAAEVHDLSQREKVHVAVQNEPEPGEYREQPAGRSHGRALPQ